MYSGENDKNNGGQGSGGRISDSGMERVTPRDVVEAQGIHAEKEDDPNKQNKALAGNEPAEDTFIRVFEGSYNNTFNYPNITTVGGNLIQNNYCKLFFRQQVDSPLSPFPDESEISIIKERLDPIVNPARKLDTCEKGTRLQLLDDLCDWIIKADTGTAWISGIAGTGKSAVAVTLASRIRDMGKRQVIFLL
ncbi:hypothetical protein VKT23_010648 [Stygiomarasmius scandens]|uniref:Uncharacterized protein n=1 Tax=Marasmiellus scandens TaxID=2682957 RepID=A0ABR1JBQ6_9AGAR